MDTTLNMMKPFQIGTDMPQEPANPHIENPNVDNTGYNHTHCHKESGLKRLLKCMEVMYTIGRIVLVLYNIISAIRTFLG